MIRRFLSVGLFALAIAVFAYGTFIEFLRQAGPRNDFLFADGVIGLTALVISGFLALIGYLLWRWASRPTSRI